MRQLVVLLKKDIALELRGKEVLALMAALSLLLAVIVAFGASSAFLSAAQLRKLFPVLVWLIFVFSATVSVGRSYEYELEHMGIEGLMLSGASPALVYLSKLISNFLIMYAAHGLAFAILALLLNVKVVPVAASFALLSVFVVGAYGALAILFAAMASTSRLRSMLLPLILLPLLFPIFFAALELSAELFASGRLPWNSFWAGLLFALNGLYIILGVNLFEFVIRE